MSEEKPTIAERQFERVRVITNHATAILVDATWKPYDPNDPINKSGRNGVVSGKCVAGTEVSRLFHAVHRRDLSGTVQSFDYAHLDKLWENQDVPTFELIFCG